MRPWHHLTLPARRGIFLTLGLLLGAPVAAQDELLVLPPNLDPGKLVNRSMGFLREREPEMTEVEYALYERMIPIVERTPELALRLLQTMLADGKASSAAFEYVLGNVYFTLRQMDHAERHFRRAVQQHPTFLRAWINLGAVYYAAQRFAEAVPCFSRAVALGDREAATFGLLASSLRDSGNVFAAESAYKQAMTSEPENPDWISGLLEIYLATEQYPPAVALARELVRTQPNEPRNWTLYTSLLVRLDRIPQALAALQVAGDLDLLSPANWELLGELYAQSNLSREAAAAYARAGDGPQGSRALTYARVLIDEGKLDQAESVLGEIERRRDAPSGVRLALARAQLARERGDLATARSGLEAVLVQEPMHGEALLALAGLHRDAGEAAAAEFLYEQALHVPTAAFAAHVELAQLALQAHDYAVAVEHTRHALNLQPADELQEFLTRLNALIDHENSASPPRA
jgi:tetratricopeptide (TPR) repeat protein